MPKITFGGQAHLAKSKLDDVEAYDEALLGLPPKGIYRLRVKRLTIRKNSKQDWMLNAVGEIAEPSTSPKAKYNAYGCWFNLNVNEKGARGINAFLDALSGGSQVVKDKFWGGSGVKVSEDRLKPVVLAIGPLKINPEGMYAHALLRNGTDQTGTKRLDVDRFLMRNGAPEESDLDNEDDGDEIIVVDADAIDEGEYVRDAETEDGMQIPDEGETGDGIIGDTSDVDDYEDEEEYVEQVPEVPEETAADVQDVADDEPPF